MGSTDARRRPAVWAALAAVYLIWGSTYLGIEVASRTFPPLLMLSLRFLIAGGLLYAWTIWRGERGEDRPGWRQWRAATIVGLVVGFAGVALLVANDGAGRNEVGGALLVLFGSLAWAAGSIYARGAPLPSRPLVGAAMEMLAGGVLLGLAGLAIGEGGDVHLSQISGESLLAFAYIIGIGSLVGFSAYIWLLGQAPLSLVGTYAYVNPVVAVLLGVVLLGEEVSWRLFVAGGAIVLAVGLIVSARPRPVPAAPLLPSTGDPLPAPAPAASLRRGAA